MRQFNRIFKSGCSTVNINHSDLGVLTSLFSQQRWRPDKQMIGLNSSWTWSSGGNLIWSKQCENQTGLQNQTKLLYSQDRDDLKQQDNCSPGGTTVMAFLVLYCGRSLKPQFSQFKRKNLARLSHECHFDLFLYVCLNSDGCSSLSLGITRVNAVWSLNLESKPPLIISILSPVRISATPGRLTTIYSHKDRTIN